MASDFTLILQDVLTLLTAVPGAPSAVVLRKKLVMVEGDSPPLWIVAPGHGGEKIAFHTFPGPGSMGRASVVYDYPVVIALVNALDELLTTNLTTNLDTRQVVRDTMYGVATGLPNSTYDLTMDPQEVSEFGAFLGSAYDVTGFGFNYRSDELMAP